MENIDTDMSALSAKSSSRIPTLTFTGHRPNKLAGYEREPYRIFVEDLVDLLYENYYKDGFRRYITGGAQGFDQLAFWAVEKMRRKYGLPDVENIVYVPFAGQERIWADDGGVFSQGDYRKMRRCADEFRILVPRAVSRGEVVSSLLARNRAMCDDADRVLALCNSDRWESDRGGTAACMQYAKDKRQMPIDRITAIRGDNGGLHIGKIMRNV